MYMLEVHQKKETLLYLVSAGLQLLFEGKLRFTLLYRWHKGVWILLLEQVLHWTSPLPFAPLHCQTGWPWDGLATMIHYKPIIDPLHCWCLKGFSRYLATVGPSKDVQLNQDLRNVCDMWMPGKLEMFFSQMYDESLHHQTHMTWLDLEVCYICFTQGIPDGLLDRSHISVCGNCESCKVWQIASGQLTPCFFSMFFCSQSGFNSYD